MSAQIGGNVRVVVRFRPQNDLESSQTGQQTIAEFQNESSLVFQDATAKHQFTFDRVFAPSTTQKQIFEYAAKPIVEDVLQGYNGTIFAYGQTGSGKTFTMQGPSLEDSNMKGVIPRIVDMVFGCISSAPDTIEFTMKVSYTDIYMERIRDLLDPSKDNLQIHEEKALGIYVKGSTELYVSSPEEVMDIMKQGASNRAVCHTRMNSESSRSHAIFVLTIQQKNLADLSVKTGKLYLVDLAGSEKVSKTGAAGQTLDEAKNINKSLTTLGMVINALTDGKSTHVPYRDSKLTRILQESLGGNARTTMIVNCSPALYNAAETLSSLRFGNRAKNIKNKAHINQELSAKELRRRLEKAEKEIKMLNSLLDRASGELHIWRSGGTVAEAEQVALDDRISVRPTTPSTPTGKRSAFTEDEHEDLVQRENTLLDQLGEKVIFLSLLAYFFFSHSLFIVCSTKQLSLVSGRNIVKPCSSLCSAIKKKWIITAMAYLTQ
eukprot:Colp12_sorted_trinity150504_noHs@12263